MISAERHFDGIINQFGSVKPCVVIGAKIQVDTKFGGITLQNRGTV